MSKSVPFLNEIVSLTVTLLMVLALVAGEADATIQDEIRSDATIRDAASKEVADVPFRTTIKTQIYGQRFTISIDGTAELSHFRFEDE